MTHVLPHDAERAFRFEITFYPNHPRLRDMPAKPPQHFHPFQDEYVSVSEGALTVEVEGIEHILQPGQPEFVLRRDVNHCLFPPRGEAWKDNHRVRATLSAENTGTVFSLDLVFFENWYAYQEQVVVHGARLDLIQVMSVRSLFKRLSRTCLITATIDV